MVALKFENEIAFEDALAYMLGGNAYVILTSDVTNKSYRYIIKKKEERKFYVYDASYHGSMKPYVGTIIRSDEHTSFVPAKPVPEDTPDDIATKENFKWVFDRLTTNIKKLPDTLHILHSGYCSVCSRKLTDPESVRKGIGPKCRGGK